MFLREAPTTTLAEVSERMAKVKVQSEDVANAEIRLDLEEDQVIHLGEKVTVPATIEGLQAIGDMVDVPSKFLERIDPDLQAHVLHTLLARNPGVARVVYTNSGVTDVMSPQAKVIDPRALVQIASQVIDPKAPVVEVWQTKDIFRLDVIVPEGFDRGIGGDKKEGDITRGGIRVIHDRANNKGAAPTVSEFLYRLECTNGLEVFDELLKVDARGQSVEEVLANFEAMADRAFKRVEKTIESFYEMRSVEVKNPEREIIRIAEEHGLPDRMAYHLAERAPVFGNGSVTQFDLVNIVTNQANDPSIHNKMGPRRRLEMVGGDLVTEHVERCSHCRARLN